MGWPSQRPIAVFLAGVRQAISTINFGSGLSGAVANGILTVSAAGGTGGTQSLSGNGTVDTTQTTVELYATAAGNGVTLPAGINDRQQLVVIAHNGYQFGGHTTVFTPQSSQGFSSIVFNTNGQTALLQWSATLGQWLLLSVRGATAS